MLRWYKLVIILFILRRKEKVTPSHVLPKPGSTVLQTQKAVVIPYCNSTRRGNEANIWNFYPSLSALACAKRLHNVLNLPAPQRREQVFPRPASTSQRPNQPVSKPQPVCTGSFRCARITMYGWVRLSGCVYMCLFVCLFGHTSARTAYNDGCLMCALCVSLRI